MPAAHPFCGVVRVQQNSLANAGVVQASRVLTEKGEQPSEDTDEKMTVAEAQAAAANTLAIVEGTVVAVNGNSAVIGDETGYIFCCQTNTYTDNAEMAVGDKTSGEGKLSAYGGFNQVTEASATKLGTSEFS